MSNSIEKYYWEAKDENEARVIWDLLHRFSSGNQAKSWCMWSRARYFAVNEYGIAGGRASAINTHSRTLSTLDDLFAMAKRGFVDAWEVPPNGYRLVTEEERGKYTKPFITLKAIFAEDEDVWDDICNDSGRWVADLIYAVPLDFTFEPVVKELTVAEIIEKLGYDVKVVR